MKEKLDDKKLSLIDGGVSNLAFSEDLDTKKQHDLLFLDLTAKNIESVHGLLFL